MTRKNVLRLALRLGAAALFALYLLALVRPSFSPETALERIQRRYGSFFTGEVYEVQADEKTTVYLGEMGSGYGLIAVDFDNGSARTPKKSYRWYRDFIAGQQADMSER